MGSESRVNVGRIIFGLFIAWLGTIFILEQLGIMEVGNIWRFWPVLIILVGVSKVFQSRGAGITGGIFFISVGTAFLLQSLHVLSLDWRLLWPGLLVFAGLAMAVRGVRWGSSAGPRPGTDSTSHFSAFAFLGGVERKIVSQDFRGGDATAIMGGAVLDLRGASIAPGTDAVIDTFAMWGGVDLKVPEDWTIVLMGQPLLGGFVDSRKQPSVDIGKRLIIKGMAIMGGIEVKN